MKIEMNLYELKELLSNVTPALGKVGWTECILLEAEGENLSAKASNAEIAIQSSAAINTNKEDGAVLVDGAKLTGIINKIDGTDSITLESKDGKLNIKAKCGKYSLVCRNESEFIYPDGVAENPWYAEVNSESLLESMNMVRVSACTDNPRMVLNGINMHVHNGGMSLRAINGFMLSTADVQMDGCSGDISVIIPSKTVPAMMKMLKGTGTVRIESDGKRFSVFDGTTMLDSGLVAGEFIDIDRVIPQNHAAQAFVNVKELKNAIDRILVVLEQKFITLGITDKGITIDTDGSMGDGAELIECDTTGAEIDVNVSPVQFRQLVGTINDEFAIVDLSGELTPVTLSTKEKNWMHMASVIRKTNSQQ